MLAAQVAVILYRLGGHFSFTLDDPYIHLALADEIARGHYGLDPGHAASPSSSILFPFLLAGLSFARLGQFAPLVVNAAATLGSGFVLGRLIEAFFPGVKLNLAAMLTVAVGLAVGLNLIGLALCGLEHSLHVTATLAWVLGAHRFLRTGRLAAWWWLAALAEPLIRYEGIALWLACVILLLGHRRMIAGLALLLAGTVLLGAFSAFLHGLGLPPLPSSVLVKSLLTGTGGVMPALGPIEHIFFTVVTNLRAPHAPVFIVTGLGLLLLVERQRRVPDPAMLQLAFAAIAVGVAHLCLGRIDSYPRYPIYAVALNVAVLVGGFRTAIAGFARRAGWPGSAALLCLLALPLHADVASALRTDEAALNIYDQQYQMHRMAADFYRAPVAVNDLGWVSYGNPFPVLDLWGLGSEEARRARADDGTGLWMDRLTAANDVGLAMIYDRWFPSRPTGWVPVARLVLDAKLVTAGGPVVTFYATAPDRIGAIRTALDGFIAGLPPHARIERIDAVAAVTSR